MLRGGQRGSRRVRLRTQLLQVRLRARAGGVVVDDHRRHLLRRIRQPRVQDAERLRLLLEVLGVGQRGGELGGILQQLGGGVVVQSGQLSDSLAELVVLALSLLETRGERGGVNRRERVVPRGVASRRQRLGFLDRRQERSEARVARGAARHGARGDRAAGTGALADARICSVRWKGHAGIARGGVSHLMEESGFLFSGPLGSRFRWNRNGKVGDFKRRRLSAPTRAARASAPRARSGRRVLRACKGEGRFERRASPRVNAGGGWAARRVAYLASEGRFRPSRGGASARDRGDAARLRRRGITGASRGRERRGRKRAERRHPYPECSCAASARAVVDGEGRSSHPNKKTVISHHDARARERDAQSIESRKARKWGAQTVIGKCTLATSSKS